VRHDAAMETLSDVKKHMHSPTVLELGVFFNNMAFTIVAFK